MAHARAAVTRIVGITSLALLTAGGALAIGAAPAGAAPVHTRYVTKSGSDTTGESPNDCTIQAQPCATIQHASNEAGNGDTISVGAGTFAESVELGQVSVTITGATSGTTTVTGNDNDPAFFIDAAEDPTTIALRHLNISHDESAPGVVSEGASVTIADSSMSDNVFAGVLVEGGSVSISDSTLSGNNGSGALVFAGALSVAASTLSNNVATNGQELGISGFGVGLLGGTATVTHSTLAGNGLAGVYAVAEEILDDASPDAPAPTAPVVTVTDSTLSGNKLIGVANGPGGTVHLADSTVDGSTGSGVYAQASLTTVKNSTISGTTKAPAGSESGPGAVVAGAGVQYLANQLPLARATSSRAVFGTSGAVSISKKGRVTVSSAKRAPAAIKRAAAVATGIQLTGTIVAQQSGVPDCSGTITDEGYNLSSDAANSCAFTAATHSQSKAAAHLGKLAANGGPTKTRLPLSGSKAIAAIPSGSAGCVSGAKDQRGDARLVAGAKCDIGAVQTTPIVIHPASLPHGTVGKAYHLTFTATGGSGDGYVWSLAPGTTLPAGLKLSSHGVLSGTPTVAGKFSVTVSVNDPTLKAYTLIIEAAAGTNGNGSAPIANTGTPVGSMLSVGGGAVFAGFLLLVGAGVIGRRPGRHRTAA